MNDIDALQTIVAPASSKRAAIRRWLQRTPRVSLLSPASAAALLGGTSLAMLQPALPSAWLLSVLLVLAAAAAWRMRHAMLPALVLLGYGWASLHGSWALQVRLPEPLVGLPLQVEGRIVGLPQPGERRMAFDFVVERGEGPAAGLADRRLRLGWYGEPPQELRPGQRWALAVKLRRPRGVLNPGGFDYERHALQYRIAATGHVREHPDNRLLDTGATIDRLRQSLSAAIVQAAPAASVRFLPGLAVGDTRFLTNADWQVLRATGLSHLLAISGLHISLLASFGVLLVRAAYWLWPTLGLRVPRPLAGAVAALVFAAGYTALAGFGLPAQRTLLMIAVALLAVLLRRGWRPLQALSVAAIVLVLFDPLAVLGAGFWLSFVGVLWLLLCLHGVGRGIGGAAKGLLRAQWAMSIGLLPLTLWFFGQASVAGVVANLVAVPWVSFVVVPTCLLGTALLPWASAPAGWILHGSAIAMEAIWAFAELLAQWPWAQFTVAEASPFALLLALVGTLWLLMPRTVPGKPFAALLLLPMLWPPRTTLAAGEWELQLFDVGQGLSLLVRTSDHALLYDAGPAFAGGLDLGEAAVLPALRALGVARIDRFIVSHGDNDHAGGAPAVRAAFPAAPVSTGEPERVGGAPCEAGASWQWSSVRFEVLHPTVGFPELGNQSSCVLRIVGAGGALLLTGDIDGLIEQRLLRTVADRLPARVLVVPHHGSGGSSVEAFVAAVAPQMALIGVGHGNRFGHPRPEVLERYIGLGSRVVDTARSGSVRLRMRADGTIELERRRAAHRRFWHERDTRSGEPPDPAPV